MRTISIYAIGAFMLLNLAGCQNSANEEQEIPQDLRIDVGEGGGATGTWQGYTIRANGEVFQWSGSLAGENPVAAGSLSAEYVQKLWTEIHTSDFLEPSISIPGNMTRFIKISHHNAAVSNAWPVDSTIGEHAAQIQQLDALYAECMSITAKAKTEPDLPAEK